MVGVLLGALLLILLAGVAKSWCASAAVMGAEPGGEMYVVQAADPQYALAHPQQAASFAFEYPSRHMILPDRTIIPAWDGGISDGQAGSRRIAYINRALDTVV